MAVSCSFYFVHPLSGFIVCLGEAEAVNLKTKSLNVLIFINFTVKYHSMHFYIKLASFFRFFFFTGSYHIRSFWV